MHREDPSNPHYFALGDGLPASNEEMLLAPDYYDFDGSQASIQSHNSMPASFQDAGGLDYNTYPGPMSMPVLPNMPTANGARPEGPSIYPKFENDVLIHQQHHTVMPNSNLHGLGLMNPHGEFVPDPNVQLADPTMPAFHPGQLAPSVPTIAHISSGVTVPERHAQIPSIPEQFHPPQPAQAPQPIHVSYLPHHAPSLPQALPVPQVSLHNWQQLRHNQAFTSDSNRLQSRNNFRVNEKPAFPQHRDDNHFFPDKTYQSASTGSHRTNAGNNLATSSKSASVPGKVTKSKSPESNSSKRRKSPYANEIDSLIAASQSKLTRKKRKRVVTSTEPNKNLVSGNDSGDQNANKWAAPTLASIAPQQPSHGNPPIPTPTSSVQPPEAPVQKRKPGAPKRKKLELSDIIKAEQEEISKLETPKYPNGIQHYIVTRGGDIYDPRFNTQEDLRRWSCKRVTELQTLGPQNSNDKRPDIITEIFPFCGNPKQLFKQGAQYWLTSLLSACRDYKTTEKLLRTGIIQAAISEFRHSTLLHEQMLLLSLIRLAAGCKTYGKTLVGVSCEIYAFLLDIYQSSNEHFYMPIRKKMISDSRAYDNFLILSMAAHTRETALHTANLSFRREAMYRNHPTLLVSAYGELAKSGPKEYIETLPKFLSQFHETLTMHDMATEIFVDVAKYGLFPYFTSSIMNAKWAKVLNQQLSDRPFDIITIQLSQVLHQAPRAVTCRMQSPYVLRDQCLNHLFRALETILENEFYKTKGPTKEFVPVRFASTCAKALIAMMKSAEHGVTPDVMTSLLQTESVQQNLVNYLFIAPYCEKLLRNEDHRELYESVWSLIHAISYTFPMMMDTLLDYACDEETPLCLSGHAAMYVGSVIAFTKHPITRKQLFRIHCTLRRYAEDAKNPDLRHLRLEVVFRLGIYLDTEKFDTKEAIESKNSEENAGGGPRTGFTSYLFKQDDDSEPFGGGAKEIMVDALSFLENDDVVKIIPEPEDLIVDDGIYPVIKDESQLAAESENEGLYQGNVETNDEEYDAEDDCDEEDEEDDDLEDEDTNA